MCFKKWFKPDPVIPAIPVNAKKRALLFGDNFVGTSYQLSGCINDIDDVEGKLLKEFSGYDIRKFKNSECTCERFYNEIKDALSVGKSGDFLLIWWSGHGTQIPSKDEIDGYEEALYMDDGPFLDKRMMELQQFTPPGMIVSANLDSCFSGGMDKVFGGASRPFKNRFHQLPDIPLMKTRVSPIAKLTSKWAIFAGCLEGQTCADASFNGRANGAYTYYDLKCWGPGITFKEEMAKLRTYLPGSGYDQTPQLIGDWTIFDSKY